MNLLRNTTLRIPAIIGLCTGASVLIYQLSHWFLAVQLVNYEFYITAIALIALLTGFKLAKSPPNISVLNARVNPMASLTKKEHDILMLISEGKSNKEIAALHFVEVATVKTHINNLYGKLGVTNRREAGQLYDRFADSQKSTLSPPLLS